MKDTAIEWCDDSVNVVEGCDEVDTDCKLCYAKGIAARFAQPQVTARRESDGAPMETKLGHYDGLARLSPGRRLPQWTGKVRLRPEVLDAMFWRLLRARSPRRQFLCSMGDIFHREVPNSFLDEVFARIAILEARRVGPPHPIYMLTKRPDRAAEYTNAPDVEARIEAAARRFVDSTYCHKLPTPGNATARRRWEALCGFTMPRWPLRSVAIITSAGTQKGTDERVPHLLRCKAAIRGVSCEPMTGPLDFSRWLAIPEPIEDDPLATHLLAEAMREGLADGPRMISWIIVGGESGDLDATSEELRPRPCELPWMESLVEQCQAAGVPAFVKQLGSVLANRLGREGKGGKIEDLPEHLRVRQHPRIQGMDS